MIAIICKMLNGNATIIDCIKNKLCLCCLRRIHLHVSTRDFFSRIFSIFLVYVGLIGIIELETNSTDCAQNNEGSMKQTGQQQHTIEARDSASTTSLVK